LSRLKPHRATQKATDKQIGGNHYIGKVQPIELIVSHDLDFIDGNIVKYAIRNKKGENLKEKYDKIIHYCELAKELKCG
jgi:predicted nuclease with TOPRIM domain|tara:strand:+ start:18 stop:254 length:237 start_codon:yes stop_codon:yes gene_type:complete